jgi:hypothetical protein
MDKRLNCYGTTCEYEAPDGRLVGQNGTVMTKVNLCTRCGARLGLGVVSSQHKFYCGNRCKEADRTALLEKLKRLKGIERLFPRQRFPTV